ncbi:MAG: hypothetical protein BroJett030_33060 [Alphaproteobacteria bacterium]|nr:MAG: hypothetical protein BroJett030_33060 [Alphaproteobacteria bacterium]
MAAGFNMRFPPGLLRPLPPRPLTRLTKAGPLKPAVRRTIQTIASLSEAAKARSDAATAAARRSPLDYERKIRLVEPTAWAMRA